MGEGKVLLSKIKEEKHLSIKAISDITGVNYQRLVRANNNYSDLYNWELDKLRELLK